MGPCKHDWRVNPNILLMSMPPKQQVVCAECGEAETRSVGSMSVMWDLNDPKTWPAA